MFEPIDEFLCTIVVIIPRANHHSITCRTSRLSKSTRMPNSNKILCLSASSVTGCVCFRCVEAMYGTSPDVVELSIWNYCGYYSSLVRNGILCEQFIFRPVISWKIYPSQYFLLITVPPHSGKNVNEYRFHLYGMLRQETDKR